MIIRLNAGNDKNGNPRRVFIVLDAGRGEIIKAIDEGYSGFGAVKEAGINEWWSGLTFDTTPSEYRSLLRLF